MSHLPRTAQRDLRRRQAESQRGFYRMLARASPGARLVAVDDVQATLVPARPWFSVFNAVLYSEAGSLRAALPTIADEYERAGVRAWSVWVPPGDEQAKDALPATGELRPGPLLMGAPIAAVDLEARMPLELARAPTWRDVARCNDRAHGVLEEWSMDAVFERADDRDSHLHAVVRDGEVVSALIAREHDRDCYLWFVATVPEAQRKGLGGELMRHALREARRRGCETTTLESTEAAEHLYAGLGYESLGRFSIWEPRLG